jgi:hypothetical protein
MQAVSELTRVSKARLWTGGILSVIVALFLLFDGIMKVMLVPVVVEGSKKAGYPVGSMVGIGWVLIACTLVYLFPRTSILGAILLTGYLGGAVATHVRIGDPLFSHVLFPVYFGVVIWGGLVLRDGKLLAYIPVRKKSA